MIRTAKDLGEAIKNDENYIEIEGDLGKKVIRIKATGKVAWLVAFGALSVAITSIIVKVSSAGIAAPVTTAALVTSAPAAIGILGGKTALTAVLIAVAGGSATVLNKLRKYNIKVTNNRTILTKSNKKLRV